MFGAGPMGLSMAPHVHLWGWSRRVAPLPSPLPIPAAGFPTSPVTRDQVTGILRVESSTAPCVFQGSTCLQAAWSRQKAAETLQAVTLCWEGTSAELGLSPRPGLGEALQSLGAGAAPGESG